MYSLTKQQWDKVEAWMKTLPTPPLNSLGIPSCGAIGGRWTYSFTPTSLGLITKVKDGLSGQEIDVSDYDDW